MNFEQEIHNQNNARRMNILKGFSDFSEDLLQKSEDGSELEKGHMDFSNQRVYADNSVNRKLNRVGQKYGGRNVEDEKVVDKKDNSEEEGDGNKPTTPQETQPNEQGQYSTEQLIEFAAQAEDWQLQEFLDNAKKSGDNSEYMQAQVNIAETELNRRRGGETSDIGEEVETDVEVDQDRQNLLNEQEEIVKKMGIAQQNGDDEGLRELQKRDETISKQLEQGGSEESSQEIDYSNSDSVKNFLNSNPEAKQAVVDMMMEDVMLSPAQALRIHQAQTQSGNEALQTVEEAKNMLDELHAKLGGAYTEKESSDDKTLMDGNSFFEKYYEIAESDVDWEPYLQEIENYINDNDLGLDDKNQERDFDNLPNEQKAKLSKMMNDAYEKFLKKNEKPSTSPAGEPNRAENSEEEDEEDYEDSEDAITQLKRENGILSGKEYDEAYGKKTDRDEFENMPEYFGKKVTRVSPWGDDKIIIEHPDGSERTLKPGDKHYDELVKFKTDTNRFDDNTNSENQSSNDKERTNEANKNSNQYGVDKVSQKSLQNIYDSGEHYEDAEDFRESVRYYNNEDSGVSDLSDKEIETWFDLYNSDKRKY